MKLWKVEVGYKPEIFDAAGEGLKKDIEDLGIKGVNSIRVFDLYFIEGNLDQKKLRRICDELLVDPVTQEFRIHGDSTNYQLPITSYQVEVVFNPGVMDPVALTTLKGIQDLGIEGVNSIKTGKKYMLEGKISSSQLSILSEKLLYNPLIQYIVEEKAQITSHQLPITNFLFKLKTISILKAEDQELLNMSKVNQWSLNLEEMKAIQKYFSKWNREPTDAELETIAQTWSEHCVHKTFKSIIEY